MAEHNSKNLGAAFGTPCVMM